jgi:PLD-like domain
MITRYVAALAFFLVGLAVGAVLIWFILPATVTLQGLGPLPGPSGSAPASRAANVAGLDKCQALVDDCRAYHDCVKRELGAEVAAGLPGCSQTAASTRKSAADVILCFSPPVPPDGCDPAAAVVHSIDEAKRSIWLQTYVLTSQAVVDSLLKAVERHVAVSLIVDKQMLEEQPELVLSLVQAGPTIRVDASVRGAARSSVMIVDGTSVLAGSFDFTNEAERWNSDDLLITSARPLVDRYQKNWDFHLAHSEPVELPTATGSATPSTATPGTTAPGSATPAATTTPAPRRSEKGSTPTTPAATESKSAPKP